MKETIWNKKFADWNLKDSLKLSCVLGAIYGVISILIDNLDKIINKLKR